MPPFLMLMSRKLKFFEPNVWAPNNGFEGGRSRLYPHGPGIAVGGCMAAKGDDISIAVMCCGVRVFV